MPFNLNFTEDQKKVLNSLYKLGLLAALTYGIVYYLDENTNVFRVYHIIWTSLNNFEVNKAYLFFILLFWTWEGIILKKPMFVLKMSFAALIMIGEGKLYSFFYSDYDTYFNSGWPLISMFLGIYVLVGFFSMFFKGKKKLLFPAFIIGLFFSYLPYQLSKGWNYFADSFSRGFMNLFRELPFLSYLGLVNFFIIPLIYFSIIYWFENNYKKENSFNSYFQRYF